MTDIVEQLHSLSGQSSDDLSIIGATAGAEIKSLRQQLAECQAREKVLGEMVGRWLGDEGWCDADMGAYDDCLACDSTALDTLKKQWQREALRDNK